MHSPLFFYAVSKSLATRALALSKTILAERYSQAHASASKAYNMTNDDVRMNKVLPEINQRLCVDGIQGIVTVTRIEQTNLLDGNKDQISNIFIKGANRAATRLLPKNYINSQDSYTILVDEEAQPSRVIVDAEWEVGDPGGLIGEKVRKYFNTDGWSNGVVTSVRKNLTSGEILYEINYVDSDVEELDQKEFDEAFAEAQFVPLRTAPPIVLALQSTFHKSRSI